MKLAINLACLTFRNFTLLCLFTYLLVGLWTRLRKQRSGPQIYLVVKETQERIWLPSIQNIGQRIETFDDVADDIVSDVVSGIASDAMSAALSAALSANMADVLSDIDIDGNMISADFSLDASGFDISGDISAGGISGDISAGGISGGGLSGDLSVDASVGVSGDMSVDAGGQDVEVEVEVEAGKPRSTADGDIEIEVDQKNIKDIKALEKASLMDKFKEGFAEGGKWAKQNPKMAAAVVAVGGFLTYVVVIAIRDDVSLGEALRRAAGDFGETAGTILREAGEVGATFVGGAFEGAFGESFGEFFSGAFGAIMDPWGYVILGVLFCVCCGGGLLKLKVLLGNRSKNQ